MNTDLEPRVTLPWLIELRWLACGGQLLALVMGHWVLGIAVDVAAFLAVSGATLATNVALLRLQRRAVEGAAGATVIGLVLAVDTGLLTGLLAASGGAMNPFTIFYVVHITLSAVVLSGAWTVLIAALSVAGFALLFLGKQDPHAFHRAAGLENHLRGMWVAFVLASGFTAFFVRRVTQAIRAQRDEIAALREASARNARLASLTTLAAGAAHELGSPLGTIAVAAHEALAVARRLPAAAAVADDLALIELETERCRVILSQMTTQAREQHGAPASVTADDVLEHLRAHLSQKSLERVEFVVGSPAFELRAPAGALAQSVAALVQNAVEATNGAERVQVRLARHAERASIAVEDRGTGIAPDVLPRIGEPFFTTKEPGRGLGLGVFLARAFVESRGGALVIEARPGGGTRAVLELPLEGMAAA